MLCLCHSPVVPSRVLTNSCSREMLNARREPSKSAKTNPTSGRNRCKRQRGAKQNIAFVLRRRVRNLVFQTRIRSLASSHRAQRIWRAHQRRVFLNGGLASVLNMMADGKSVEVGLCGSEGFRRRSAMRWICHQPRPRNHASSRQRIQVKAEDFRGCPPRLPYACNRRISIFAGDGVAIRASRRLQPSSLNRRSPRSMASDVARPPRWRYRRAHAGIPGAHARHPQSQRNNRRGSPTKGQDHHLQARRRENCQPRPSRTSHLRMLRNHEAPNRQMALRSLLAS